MRASAHTQRGITFVGFIMIAAALIFVAITGMKLVPAYIHNAQIARIFKEITSDPAMRDASIKDIKESYNKRASMNYITDITSEDIEINKEGGQLSLSASYTVRIPIAGNATLLLEFNPSSS
jgi:hypothetical protein